MTNTPDLASIVMPLKKTVDSNDGYIQYSNKSLMIDYVIGPDFDLGYYVNDMTEDKWPNDSYHEAVKRMNNHYNQIVLSTIDLTKLQQPEPFWKPIEQCPKEEGQEYLLRDDTDKNVIASWNNRYSEWSQDNGTIYHDDELTHYAEIPPCEVQS